MWLLFIYFATISVVAGVLTVSLRNAVHCAMALLTLLLHMAGLFVMLNAEFLAAVQIIVYAGAILILYLFVLMLMNLKTEEQHLHKKYSYLFFALWRKDGVGYAGGGFNNRSQPCGWHNHV